MARLDNLLDFCIVPKRSVECCCEMARKGLNASKASRWAAYLGQSSDSRPLWRRVDAKAGLPLFEAMLYYGNQADAVVVSTLTFQSFGEPLPVPEDHLTDEELKEYHMNSWILRDRRQRMEVEFTWKLRRGEVIATGYRRDSPLDLPATTILPDRWRLLEPNFQESSASGPGGDIAGILIFPSRPAAASNVNDRAAFSPARLHDWYIQYIASHQEDGTFPSREDDHTAARAVFGKAIPRSALRKLRRELAPTEWQRHGRRRKSL